MVMYSKYYSMHFSASALKHLDAVYDAALHFITGANYHAHHCLLYTAVGWDSLKFRRSRHWLMFVYKAVLQKLPFKIRTREGPKSRGQQERQQSALADREVQVQMMIGAEMPSRSEGPQELHQQPPLFCKGFFFHHILQCVCENCAQSAKREFVRSGTDVG
ncbi:hypothetical protein UPYG_G00072140 [Umbra pygmaea]|uniref:Uncharacterized protein n=1 Tax=Umbra pygmaea TaxID=75934 RepID=A0ABD0XCD2_UMBPY